MPNVKLRGSPASGRVPLERRVGPPHVLKYATSCEVDTLKRASNSTFEVYNLAPILRCLDSIEGEILVHPKIPDKSTTINPPKLLDQVRDKLRVKHYSIPTKLQAAIDQPQP